MGGDTKSKKLIGNFVDTLLKLLTEYWMWAAIAGGAIVVLVILLRVVKRMSGAKKPEQKASGQAGQQLPIAEADYEIITKRIVKLGNKCRSVLFASGWARSLPITIPVNVAIGLAKNNGKKCLLIDLDLKRNAAAKVFNIDDKLSTKEVQPRAYDTEIDGLQIWPADNFTKSKRMDIKSLVTAASEKYDIVLINAPHLNGSPDRKRIASSAEYGFIFSRDSEEADNIETLIKGGGCKPIGNMQIK